MQQKKLILILLLFSLFACKKDIITEETEVETVPPESTSLKKFSCNLNGLLFETDSVDSSPYYIDSIGNFKILSCGGIKNSTFVGFGIGFPNVTLSFPATVMGYPNASVHLHRIVNGVYYDSYSAITTSLQITLHDTIAHKISGTFTGTVVENVIHDTVIINNGKFSNLSYFLVY